MRHLRAMDPLLLGGAVVIVALALTALILGIELHRIEHSQDGTE